MIEYLAEEPTATPNQWGGYDLRDSCDRVVRVCVDDGQVVIHSFDPSMALAGTVKLDGSLTGLVLSVLREMGVRA